MDTVEFHGQRYIVLQNERNACVIAGGPWAGTKCDMDGRGAACRESVCRYLVFVDDNEENRVKYVLHKLEDTP